VSTLRLAVVGAGHLGRIHARLAGSLQGARLVAVADPSPQARAQVAAAWGVETVDDYRALLGRVDAAIVAAPTALHHAIALELADAGIHLLVEKPLALDLEQADAMIAAADRSGLVLQVGHVEQFNPAWRAARPWLREPKYVNAVRAGGFTFRSTDVGVVLDLMIHDLDLVLSLTEAPLRSVQALGLAVLGRHEDVAQARLEFADGLVADLAASRVSPQPRREMQLWCGESHAWVDFAQRTVRVVRPSPAVLDGAVDVAALTAGQTAEAAAQPDSFLAEHLPSTLLPVEQGNALADEQAEFVASIREGRAPLVSGRRGRAALAAAEQVLQSIAAHRWEGRADGPQGPLARRQPGVLRGPHWQRAPQATPTRREAG
jgi:predicted dehydrogenase